MDKNDMLVMHALSRAKTGTTELNKLTGNMAKTSAVVNIKDNTIDDAKTHYYRVRVQSKKYNSSSNKHTRYNNDKYDAESSSSDGKYF
jgi:hypothetical protein